MKSADIPQDRARKTLMSEKEAIEALDSLFEEESFAEVVRLLEERKGKIIVTGVGKSGFIAMKIAATLTSLGHSAFFLSPTDALHGDAGIVHDDDVVLALSFSGNTAELVRLISYIKQTYKTEVVALTGEKNSKLAHLADASIIYAISDEGCPLGLAPMASTSAALVVGDMLAAALTSPETFQESQFAKYHPAGSLGFKLRKVDELMRSKEDSPCIADDKSFLQALEAIETFSLGVVGVVGEGKLVGCITDGDVRRGVKKGGDIEHITLAQVMSTSPKVVQRDTSLHEALSIMETNKITSLFVVGEQNTLEGFIHMHDIIESQLKG